MTQSPPLPPPGQLVDVGGYALHYLLMGETHNGPTVILVSTRGSEHLEWFRIQREVASFARVLSYDRAGLGWSQPSSHTPTPDQTARDLHDLLTRAAIDGPYIVVGASAGGIYARRFVTRYPDGVAGLVLVDSAHEAQESRFPPAYIAARQPQRDEMHAALEKTASLTHAELVEKYRVEFPILFTETGPFPPDIGAQIVDRLTPECMAAGRDETLALDAFLSSGQEPAPLGDLPLIVLEATQRPPVPGIPDDLNAAAHQVWLSLQAELAALSTAGTLIPVDCGHAIAMLKPDVVIEAIRQMVERVSRQAG